MTVGRVLFASAAALIGCSCSTLNREGPGPEPHASQFWAEIVRLKHADPGSPAVLSARLTYAEFLLSETSGACAHRLEQARAELRAVAEDPVTRALFPDGWARTADLDYRLHFASAACSGPDSSRKFDLWTAVDSARRAVELYRDAFDYRSMVIMQFDLAVALRQLGETAAAIAALRSAIDMDREYGFRDDAEENHRLLLTWRGEPSSPDRVAALVQDFPNRQTKLEFRWHAGDAPVAIESRRVSLANGKLNESRAAAKLEERVRAGRDGWSVSQVITHYDPGVWPASQRSPAADDIFPPALLGSPSFEVSRTGDFERVSNSEAFASRIAGNAYQFIRAHAPVGWRSGYLTDDALEMTRVDLWPELFEAAAVRNYSLETAMWVGATLHQGVWYKISEPLALPGIPRVVMLQTIEFAYTRTVPCTAQSTERACVEIVLHITPDAAALATWLGDMQMDGSLLHYDCSLDIRIVTDPATLLLYTREERAYWYASVGNGRGNQLIESEHTTSSTGWGSAVALNAEPP